MNELQVINNTRISVKEFSGQRVVTFKDIDAVHGRPDGTARKRFNDNREHFITGEDFFVLTQPSEIRTLGIAQRNSADVISLYEIRTAFLRR